MPAAAWNFAKAAPVAEPGAVLTELVEGAAGIIGAGCVAAAGALGADAPLPGALLQAATPRTMAAAERTIKYFFMLSHH